jgi:REP element-mobilizing transposase RayT
LDKGQPELQPSERDLVASSLKHFDEKHYKLTAFVVMNDHVYVLLSMMLSHHLENVIHSWKSFTANRMQRDHGRRGHIWQEQYFDRIVRDEEEFVQKLEYIQNNPWTRWPELGPILGCGQ